MLDLPILKWFFIFKKVDVGTIWTTNLKIDEGNNVDKWIFVLILITLEKEETNVGENWRKLRENSICDKWVTEEYVRLSMYLYMFNYATSSRNWSSITYVINYGKNYTKQE